MKNIIILFFTLILFLQGVTGFAVVNNYEKKSKELIAFEEKKKEIIALYNTNKLEDAYNEISKIPENERDYELWYLLGNLAQDLNNTATASFYLQKSIMLKPDYDKASYNLGNIFLAEKKYNNAIAAYKNAIKYKKDFPYYYYNLGCAYLGLKEYKEAKSAFEKAIKLKPAPEFYYNLAIACKLAGKEKEKEEALAEYNKLTGENLK